MKKISYLYSIAALFIFLSACAAQKNANVKLTKLVYHSSFCFGTCPRIDMQVDGDRNMYVSRQFFSGKGREDTAGSGQFKGVLDKATYDKMIGLLAKSDYSNLKFPAVTCCDGVITTIIVYANDKRTYLKSMTPPKEASELIAFLKKISLETKLEKTSEKTALEE